ncbi:MAG: AbrB/MazE/SpoVT family DNA-binding domain-containing protein [Candidatus Aenigmarchaeota archaeon]|nr:AbrB/MazE/SpoVT family DNA-binding domain-containing protein [Candidatus Aenigmarchaeota archaeon]
MKNKKCPMCEKGMLLEVDNIVSEMDGYIFIEKGQRCTECREEFIHEKNAQRTIEVAKKLGIWPQPLKLHRSLSKSGRGLVLRIPSDLEKDFKLKAGESVSISKVGNKIVIEPED